MSYPLEIMPKADYRELTDLGEIIKNTKICLLRRVDGIDSSSSEEEIKKIFADNIVSDRGQLNEYSLFLLGGEFEEKHLSITVNINKDTSDNWTEGNSCDLNDFVGRVVKKENFAAIYFYGDEIHDVDFTKVPLQENKQLTERLINASTSTGHANSNKSFLIHKPMNFNYWHVQIHFFDAEGNEFPKKTKLKKRHKEALVVFLQSVLMKRIRFKHNIEAQCCRIDPALYHRS